MMNDDNTTPWSHAFTALFPCGRGTAPSPQKVGFRSFEWPGIKTRRWNVRINFRTREDGISTSRGGWGRRDMVGLGDMA